MIGIGKIILSTILSFSVLLSSVGFSVEKMVCLSSGKATYALGAVQDCCPPADAEEGFFFTKKCCDYAQYDFEVDEFFVEKTFSINSKIIAEVYSHPLLSFSVFPEVQEWKVLPPLIPTGKSLLYFFQVLRL